MFEHPTFFQKSNLSVTRRLRRRLGLNTQVDSEGVGGLSLEMSKNCRKMCIRTLQTVSDGSHNVSPEMLNFGKYRFFSWRCYLRQVREIDSRGNPATKIHQIES